MREDEMDALEFFANQVTYYDNQNALQQQREAMELALRQQTRKYEARVREEQNHLLKLRELEARYKIKALDNVNTRNTAQHELMEKLQVVLKSFQYMDPEEKQRVILGVIEALHAHITADTLVSITQNMSLYEKDKLLRELFQDEIGQLTEKIRAEVIATSSAQQNAILERSAARITRFQTLIWDRLRGSSETSDGTTVARRAGDDEDLCDQDRKVLESIGEMMDELQAERRKTTDFEQRLREAEQTINSLRWKINTQIAEAQEAAVRHAREVADLREEIAKTLLQREHKEVQTDRQGLMDTDDMRDGEDDAGGSNSPNGRGGRGTKHRPRKRLSAMGEDDDEEELLVKNRRLNKHGIGIASLIELAKIPPTKIRKILSKRKPLTLNELHAIIVGYYQAKMFQDIQDDNVGKMRANLAQFIMDMYTLHYGLKDLAISQLVFLDASIRKHAAESARVRTFGLLTGSLEPDSHACSVQGVDFFLFVVIVMFNAGTYKRGRKQAVHVAQNLKSFFGEGIFMNPKSVSLRSDVVCTTVDLVFSFLRNDPGGKLDRLKDEIRLMSSSQNPHGGIEVDMALEKVMNYWFMLYEQQIDDIHAMFTLMDTNGDGMLDFREFCEVVNVLEPGMDRREVLAIYNRAAGDDNVIDKDEFVQVMLAHQRGVILREFYSGDNHKRVMSGLQQRKQTYPLMGSPSPSDSSGSTPYKAMSSAMAMAQLDREESYASLVAAMATVTEALQPLVTVPLVDDEGGDDVGDASATAEEPRVQENVSFLTLSRLSMWASEAKGKLQVSRPGTSTLAPATSAPLTSIAEGSAGGDSFAQDVDRLLQQALSMANIDADEVKEVL
ncbi:hypothetical protein P43SY_005615 [Pythium insidiosum]|uniref:EF-hand domain-containing protein n=1 Tax=Pythium insidiosum TaxID=114742 RepID=A0AAD5Q736_PYTIN|nr:hypothetical protein P43SY_005615 [Pythium insidiosum]